MNQTFSKTFFFLHIITTTVVVYPSTVYDYCCSSILNMKFTDSMFPDCVDSIGTALQLFKYQAPPKTSRSNTAITDLLATTELLSYSVW